MIQLQVSTARAIRGFLRLGSVLLVLQLALLLWLLRLLSADPTLAWLCVGSASISTITLVLHVTAHYHLQFVLANNNEQ